MTRKSHDHHTDATLQTAARLGREFLSGLDQRPVGPPVAVEALRQALGGALPDAGEDPGAVLEALARGADPGIVASAGPRYFGFVTGGALPAALGADWLTSAWDQNAWTYVASPAASVVEEVAGGWLVDLLGLPASTSVGFTTGATMASFSALAAARHAVLARAGHDVEEQGLSGAPEIALFAGEAAHATIYAALQMLGLGRARVRRIAADDAGRMRPEALRQALAEVSGPAIVCAQAGEVNTGSFDPLEEIAELCSERGAWLHVDGAFGLWAAASPELRHLTRGADRADSWTVDGHKWLNVPYDSGYVFVRDGAALRAALAVGAAYYPSAASERENFHLVPESSRRARGFPTWAALRSLGRHGVAELVERCCALASRMADALRDAEGVELLNEVVLNQVLVRFHPPSGDPDAFTREVIRRIQADGICWLGGTTWQGRAAARISISSAATTGEDVDRSAEAILGCVGGG
ncbi:MAG: aspartate aminotransferase family protein [Acidobacteria bacterium]|nr:MAG: aspartate aminotransferase family protein [Acidobacteriota bacterium]REK10084.1 MAG: aspartate aminotransferase family protein [Acidobacteriota bacterium]